MNDEIVAQFREFCEQTERKKAPYYYKVIPPAIFRNRFLFRGILRFVRSRGWEIDKNWRYILPEIELNMGVSNK